MIVELTNALEKLEVKYKQTEKERDHNFAEYQRMFGEYTKVVGENEVRVSVSCVM